MVDLGLLLAGVYFIIWHTKKHTAKNKFKKLVEKRVIKYVFFFVVGRILLGVGIYGLLYAQNLRVTNKNIFLDEFKVITFGQVEAAYLFPVWYPYLRYLMWKNDPYRNETLFDYHNYKDRCLDSKFTDKFNCNIFIEGAIKAEIKDELVDNLKLIRDLYPRNENGCDFWTYEKVLGLLDKENLLFNYYLEKCFIDQCGRSCLEVMKIGEKYEIQDLHFYGLLKNELINNDSYDPRDKDFKFCGISVNGKPRSFQNHICINAYTKSSRFDLKLKYLSYLIYSAGMAKNKCPYLKTYLYQFRLKDIPEAKSQIEEELCGNRDCSNVCKDIDKPIIFETVPDVYSKPIAE